MTPSRTDTKWRIMPYLWSFTQNLIKANQVLENSGITRLYKIQLYIPGVDKIFPSAFHLPSQLGKLWQLEADIVH